MTPLDPNGPVVPVEDGFFWAFMDEWDYAPEDGFFLQDWPVLNFYEEEESE